MADVLPDFIPSDILDEHLEGARRDVSGSYRAWRRPRPRSLVAAPDRPAVAVGLLLGLVGSLCLSALWAWLATATGEGIWWVFAGVGALLAVLIALGAAALEGEHVRERPRSAG